MVGKCEEISLGKFVVLLDFVIAIFGDLVLYSHLFNLLCLKWQLEMHFHSLLCYNFIFFLFGTVDFCVVFASYWNGNKGEKNRRFIIFSVIIWLGIVISYFYILAKSFLQYFDLVVLRIWYCVFIVLCRNDD